MSVHIANQIIKKEWTDYNNHMNMAYYVLVFDQIWEIILEKFKMGEQSAKSTKMSTMVVETHTTYNNEVKEGDEVEINLTFFDHDKKRLHFKMEMIEKSSKKLSATLEMLSLYIDLDKRRVTEFEDEKVKLMDNFINLNKSNFKNDDLVITGKLKKLWK
jgi:acyl-CoA thioester hydrolase